MDEDRPELLPPLRFNQKPPGLSAILAAIKAGTGGGVNDSPIVRMNRDGVHVRARRQVAERPMIAVGGATTQAADVASGAVRNADIKIGTHGWKLPFSFTG